MQLTSSVFEVISYKKWQKATEKELWEVVNQEMVKLFDYLWHCATRRAERAVLEEESNWDDETKAKWDKAQLEHFNKMLKEIRRDEFKRSIVLGFDRLQLIKTCLIELGMPNDFKSPDHGLDNTIQYLINSRKAENQKFENEIQKA